MSLPDGGRAEAVQRLSQLLSGANLACIQDAAARQETAQALEDVAAPRFAIRLVGPPRWPIRVLTAIDDGFVAAFYEWLRPFDDFSINAEEQVKAGEKIVVPTRLTATPQGSAVTVEHEAAAVISFADDRPSRIELHFERATADQAAGLTTVTMSFIGGTTFEGEIESRHPDCAGSRRVRLIRREEGPDQVIARGVSDEDGSWRIEVEDEDELVPGRYLVRVKPTEACAAARSKVVRVTPAGLRRRAPE